MSNHKLWDIATSLRNEVDTAFIGTFDVVAEREEGIATQRNTVVLGYPLALLR